MKISHRIVIFLNADFIKDDWNMLALQKVYLLYSVLSYIFVLISRESNESAATNRLKSCRPPVYHFKMGESHQVPFPMAEQVNLPVCSLHYPFNAERQTGKL